MQVKCPRCRLHFYTPLTPGVNTLQCFCPRCGQPFFYDLAGMPDVHDGQSLEDLTAFGPGVVGNSVDADGVRVETEENSVENKPVYSERDARNCAGEATAPVADDASATLNVNDGHAGYVYGKSNYGGVNYGMGNNWAGVQRSGGAPKGGHCAGILLKIVALLAVGMMVLYFLLYRNEPPLDTIDDDEVTRVLHQHQSNKNYVEPTDDDVAPADTLSWPEEDDEVAPDWIEGTWHAYTDYGGIDVTISGRTISETTDGETSRGTFRYHDNALYCDFGDDDKPFVYRLYPDRKCIDAGNGIVMKRME